MPKYKSWARGVDFGDPKKNVVVAEDVFLPSVETLGFPFLRADLTARELSPLAQVYLLQLQSLFSLGTELMPPDSPLCRELVDRRNAVALGAVQRLTQQPPPPRPPAAPGGLFGWLRRGKPKSVAEDRPPHAPTTFVLPWHVSHCAGLALGLAELGFVEQGRRLHPTRGLPLADFLWNRLNHPFHRVRDRDGLERELRAAHGELLEGLQRVLEQTDAELGPALGPRLAQALEEHIEEMRGRIVAEEHTFFAQGLPEQ